MQFIKNDWVSSRAPFKSAYKGNIQALSWRSLTPFNAPLTDPALVLFLPLDTSLVIARSAVRASTIRRTTMPMELAYWFFDAATNASFELVDHKNPRWGGGLPVGSLRVPSL